MLVKLLLDFVKSQSSRTDDGSTGVMDVVRTLRALGGTLGAQAGLYGELIQLELDQERQRLVRLGVLLLVTLMAAWCVLLFGSLLILAIVWETDYRVPVIGGVVGFFFLVLVLALWRFNTILARSGRMFASVREELAADVALIKSQL